MKFETEHAFSSDFRLRQVPLPQIAAKAPATYRRRAERDFFIRAGAGMMLRP
ncbi:hypothetical protein [Bradyrhizobium sp. Ce-3]|uniref:hypothetical protein n=1 Tax=Bradyrhizobium sp. Ce-3 TaxID=2913970 RepID=UPI001FC8B928|nr:hypothetical protein [Bradyrhizobium sp. Ce-3]